MRTSHVYKPNSKTRSLLAIENNAAVSHYQAGRYYRRCIEMRMKALLFHEKIGLKIGLSAAGTSMCAHSISPLFIWDFFFPEKHCKFLGTLASYVNLTSFLLCLGVQWSILKTASCLMASCLLPWRALQNND